MDKNAEHIVKAIDAVARGVGQDANGQKAINHSLRALTGMGAIPDRDPGKPWFAVSITPERHWNTADGDMPVQIIAETGEDKVDTDVEREVTLCGDQIGYWQVPLVAGRASVLISVNTYSPNGEGQLFVLDASEPQRQGSTPSFTWS